MSVLSLAVVTMLAALTGLSNPAAADQPETTSSAIVAGLESERALFEKVAREVADKLRKDLKERERIARRAGDQARSDALAGELQALSDRGVWPGSAPSEDARRLRIARQRLDEQFGSTIDQLRAARFGGADMLFRHATQEREWYAGENALIPWSSLLPDAEPPAGWTREGTALVADGDDEPKPLVVQTTLPQRFRLEILTSADAKHADPKHAALGFRLNAHDQACGRLDVIVGKDGVLDASICPGTLVNKIKPETESVSLGIIRRASHTALEVGSRRLLDLRSPCEKPAVGPTPTLTITPQPRTRLRIEALRVKPITSGVETLPGDTPPKEPATGTSPRSASSPAIAPPILAGAPQYLQAKSRWEGTLDRDSERDLPVTASVESVDEEHRTIVLHVKLPNQRETWTLNYTGTTLALSERTGGKSTYENVSGTGLIGQQGFEMRYSCKRSGGKHNNQPEAGVLRLKPK